MGRKGPSPLPPQEGEQFEFILCEQTLKNINSRTIERRLGPAQMKNKRPSISHSQSQETSLIIHVQKDSLEVKTGAMLSVANYP